MYSCGSTVEYHRLAGETQKNRNGDREKERERERRLGVMIFIRNYLDIWSDVAILFVRQHTTKIFYVYPVDLNILSANHRPPAQVC
jgi:hypothetical protein